MQLLPAPPLRKNKEVSTLRAVPTRNGVDATLVLGWPGIAFIASGGVGPTAIASVPLSPATKLKM